MLPVSPHELNSSNGGKMGGPASPDNKSFAGVFERFLQISTQIYGL